MGGCCLGGGRDGGVGQTCTSHNAGCTHTRPRRLDVAPPALMTTRTRHRPRPPAKRATCSRGASRRRHDWARMLTRSPLPRHTRQHTPRVRFVKKPRFKLHEMPRWRLGGFCRNRPLCEHRKAAMSLGYLLFRWVRRVWLRGCVFSEKRERGLWVATTIDVQSHAVCVLLWRRYADVTRGLHTICLGVGTAEAGCAPK